MNQSFTYRTSVHSQSEKSEPKSSNYSNAIHDIPYFKVHDVVLEINNQTLWIFAINPSHKLNSFVSQNIVLHEGLFKSVSKTHRFILCAFNDGTTVISHQIHSSPTFSSYNVIIRCDVPSHLLSAVLSSGQYTNITVSLITPRYIPSSGLKQEMFEFDLKRHSFPNLNVDISSCIIEALPVCSTFEVNTINASNSNTKSVDLWHSTAYSSTTNFSFNRRRVDHEHPERVPLKRVEFAKYKYNISACVMVYGLKMDHNIEHHLKLSQIAIIIRDWIEYHHYVLGIEHFIFYEHFPTESAIAEVQRKYARKYGMELDTENITRLVLDALSPFITSGLVTYIKWEREYQVPWTFQYSQMNSCIKRFGHSGHSKYLMMTDIDEFIIPQHQFQGMTLMELIAISISNDTETVKKKGEWPTNAEDLRQKMKGERKKIKYLRSKLDAEKVSKEDLRYFRNIGLEVYCYKLFTCKARWGCNEERFETVLERQQCMSRGYGSDGRKVIVKASEVEYMFVHYIDKYVDGTTSTYWNPYTRRLKNVLCGHAKSQLFGPEDGESQRNDQVERIVMQYHDHVKGFVISRERDSLLPLFADNETFC